MVGRTLTSRKRRAETKRLHRSLSTPHIPDANSSDLSAHDDAEDIEDAMDLDDPEVHPPTDTLLEGSPLTFHVGSCMSVIPVTGRLSTT